MVEGDEAADEGDDEGDGDGGELDPQPAVGPGLAGDALGLLPLVAVAGVATGVEELPLQLGEVVDAGGGDVEGDLEAGAAVERARVALELDPGRRRVTEVAEHDDRFAVLLDPAPQAGPLAQQRLVGQLDGRHPRLRDGGRG